MVFYNLLTTALSSVFYGIVITAAIMAILYFVLKSLSNGVVKSIPFYVAGVVLAVLLVVQFSLMVGAFQAKDAADSAEIYLSQLLDDQRGTVTAQTSQQIMDAVTEHFPIIGNYLNLADFSGHEISDLPEKMHETMTGYLSSYIWHRVWWILGIIVVAVVIAICFEKKGYNPQSDYYRNFEKYTES